MWLAAEEESFGRTLDQGTQTLAEEVERVRASGAKALSAEVVFRLHDTYGLPYDMTRELLADEGLSIEGDFDELMEAQRERGRAGNEGRGRGRRRDPHLRGRERLRGRRADR